MPATGDVRGARRARRQGSDEQAAHPAHLLFLPELHPVSLRAAPSAPAQPRCEAGYTASSASVHASRETGAPTSQAEPLLDARNTLVAAELDMRVVAVADHVIDLGPGAGDAGGTVVAAGTPAYVADKGVGASAGYLAAALQAATNVTSM